MQIFFDALKNKIFTIFGLNKAAVVSGPKQGEVVRWENYPIPPTVGEMANNAAIKTGTLIYKVFSPLKWILFGISAVMIAWGFLKLVRR